MLKNENGRPKFFKLQLTCDHFLYLSKCAHSNVFNYIKLLNLACMFNKAHVNYIIMSLCLCMCYIGATTVDAYFPKGSKWYEILTGKLVSATGGDTVTLDSPIDYIPVSCMNNCMHIYTVN